MSHPGFALGVGKKKVGVGGLTWVNAQVLFKKGWACGLGLGISWARGWIG